MISILHLLFRFETPAVAVGAGVQVDHFIVGTEFGPGSATPKMAFESGITFFGKGTRSQFGDIEFFGFKVCALTVHDAPPIAMMARFAMAEAIGTL
jgi:hypothetical protein